jgi:hypothetical protein
MTNTLKRLFDRLADMGIWIRFNDPRTAPPDEEGRIWGAAVNGLVLSIEAPSLDSLSIILKNVGDADRKLHLPGWMSFYQIQIWTPFNQVAPMKSFGKETISSPTNTALTERIILAGKSLAAEIPLGPLFDLRARGIWRIQVTCEIEGATLVSNELKIQRP